MCIRSKKDNINETQNKDSKTFSIGLNMKITFNYITNGAKKRTNRKS